MNDGTGKGKDREKREEGGKERSLKEKEVKVRKKAKEVEKKEGTMHTPAPFSIISSQRDGFLSPIRDEGKGPLSQPGQPLRGL